MPPYTSHVVVELRKKGRDYWVTVEHDEVLLSVPGCSDEVCELQEFLEYVLSPHTTTTVTEIAVCCLPF